ncbi:hypothetical protein [Actinosynnema sp. NPDC020468]|uniref:hypothetical protein n=1 Tax=Actinosynnema sp. NPDC020468 TaxID=3154488 RepID=UPI003404BBA2
MTAATTARGWPGWVPRAVVGATGLAVAAVLAHAGTAPLALGLYLVLTGVGAAIPASAAPALLIGYPAVAVLFADDAGAGHVLALVVLLHLLHVSSAYAAVLPVRSRVHPKALVAPLRRFALVQLVVLVASGAVLLLPQGRTDERVEVIGLTAVAGLVVGVVLLMRRRS